MGRTGPKAPGQRHVVGPNSVAPDAIRGKRLPPRPAGAQARPVQAGPAEGASPGSRRPGQRRSALLRDPPAIDGQRRPGDRRRGVGAQEHRQRPDPLRRGEPQHRLLLRQEALRRLLDADAVLSPPAPPTAARTSGVFTQPGQIALAVMPELASSIAATLVMPTTPCLAAT